MHITGLTEDETLSIHTATGVLIHRSIITSAEVDIPLSGNGVYFVRSGNNTVKIVVGF